MTTSNTFCIWFELKTSGYLIGYISLILRSIILLSLTFSLMVTLILSNASIMETVNSQFEYNSSSVLKLRFSFNYIWIILVFIILLIFGVISSMCFIFGIKQKNKKLLLPYIAFDTMLSICALIYWIDMIAYNATNMHLFMASIILGILIISIKILESKFIMNFF